MNSRLFSRIRDKEGLSYGVGSRLAAVPKENLARFFTFAICAPQNAPKVEASYKDEMKKILADGYAASEVDAAKKSWAQSRQVSRANDGELVGSLTNESYFGRTMAFDAEMEAKVLALTPDQIRAAMSKYLKLDDLSYVRAGDFVKAKVAW